MAGYWDQVLNRRVGRRKALIGAGATGAGAAFLAACFWTNEWIDQTKKPFA